LNLPFVHTIKNDGMKIVQIVETILFDGKVLTTLKFDGIIKAYREERCSGRQLSSFVKRKSRRCNSRFDFKTKNQQHDVDLGYEENARRVRAARYDE
jgi:hypothetical protein